MHVTLCFNVMKTFSQVLYNMGRELCRSNTVVSLCIYTYMIITVCEYHQNGDLCRLLMLFFKRTFFMN